MLGPPVSQQIAAASKPKPVEAQIREPREAVEEERLAYAFSGKATASKGTIKAIKAKIKCRRMVFLQTGSSPNRIFFLQKKNGVALNLMLFLCQNELLKIPSENDYRKNFVPPLRKGGGCEPLFPVEGGGGKGS